MSEPTITAEQAKALYLRHEQLSALIRLLEEERSKIRRETLPMLLGVAKGDVVTGMRWRGAEPTTGQVLNVHGDWNHARDEGNTMLAAAVCTVAPKTKDGFHSRTRADLNLPAPRETKFTVTHDEVQAACGAVCKAALMAAAAKMD